jgi:hypothetical protein
MQCRKTPNSVCSFDPEKTMTEALQKATCETHRHLRGPGDRCIMCREDLPPKEGPIELLCKEIGIEFDKKLETVDMVVAFVSVLVSEIAHLRWIDEKCGPKTGKPPTDNSAKAILLMREVLTRSDRELLINGAASVHDLVHTVNPDEGPCDHVVDMISSCASAIRFGLEKPCRSRHAADAASHIWKHVYGVQLFDGFTAKWQREWSRAKFQQALIERLP